MVEVLWLGFLKMKLRNQLSEISNGSGMVVPVGQGVVFANELKFVPRRGPNHSGAPFAFTGPSQILFTTVPILGEKRRVVPSVLQVYFFPTRVAGSKVQSPGAAMIPSSRPSR